MKKLALPLLTMSLSLFGVFTASAQTQTYTKSAASGVCGGSQNCQATFSDGSKFYWYFSAANPYGLAIRYVGQTCGSYGCTPGPDYDFAEGNPFCTQPNCADPNISGGVGEIDFLEAVVADDGQPTGQVARGKLTYLYGKACGICSYRATNIVLSYSLK